MATETSLIFVFAKDAFNYLAVDSFDLPFFSSCVPSLLFSFSLLCNYFVNFSSLDPSFMVQRSNVNYACGDY